MVFNALGQFYRRLTAIWLLNISDCCIVYFSKSFVVCYAPCSCSLETLSTLKFAQRAKFIKNNVRKLSIKGAL